MRKLGLTAAAAMCLLAAPAAHATLNCVASIDGVVVANCLPSNNGTLVLPQPVVSPLFSAITLTGSGFPAIPSPNLSTVTLDVTSSAGFTGTHTLELDIFQSGLVGGTPGASVSSTFTINHLIGAPLGAATLNDFFNGTASTLGTFLNGAAFPAGATNATVGPDVNVIGPAITADAQQYIIAFTGPNQSANDTIQLIATPARVPEPASLALLGTALAGLGVFGFRRRRKAA